MFSGRPRRPGTDRRTLPEPAPVGSQPTPRVDARLLPGQPPGLVALARGHPPRGPVCGHHLLPQQSMAPSLHTPQVLKSPLLTARKVPPGTEGQALGAVAPASQRAVCVDRAAVKVAGCAHPVAWARWDRHPSDRLKSVSAELPRWRMAGDGGPTVPPGFGQSSWRELGQDAVADPSSPALGAV